MCVTCFKYQYIVVVVAAVFVDGVAVVVAAVAVGCADIKLKLLCNQTVCWLFKFMIALSQMSAIA